MNDENPPPSTQAVGELESSEAKSETPGASGFDAESLLQLKKAMEKMTTQVQGVKVVFCQFFLNDVSRSLGLAQQGEDIRRGQFENLRVLVYPACTKVDKFSSTEGKFFLILC